MENMSLYPAIVTNGECIGRTGMATCPNNYGNVMFYPAEGIHPYCICKPLWEIRYFVK